MVRLCNWSPLSNQKRSENLYNCSCLAMIQKRVGPTNASWIKFSLAMPANRSMSSISSYSFLRARTFCKIKKCKKKYRHGLTPSKYQFESPLEMLQVCNTSISITSSKSSNFLAGFIPQKWR